MALNLNSKFTFLFHLLFLLGTVASATVLTLENQCGFTVWPGILSVYSDAIVGDGGFSLPSGSAVKLTPPSGWSGRFWARTGCNFDGAGKGNCATGDCPGGLKCNGRAVRPVTLAEFTIGSATNGNKVSYDVSLVDGYNVGMEVKATGGTGDCQKTGCVLDLIGDCPEELKFRDYATDRVLACYSACLAFKTDEFCCTGAYATSQTCSPTHYSKIFKEVCPKAYSYVNDDASSIFTCSGSSDYRITFCPYRSAKILV